MRKREKKIHITQTRNLILVFLIRGKIKVGKDMNSRKLISIVGIIGLMREVTGKTNLE